MKYKYLHERTAMERDKAIDLVHKQEMDLSRTKRENLNLMDNINSLIEINMLLRNCGNCQHAQTGCCLISCKDDPNGYPDWKMGVLRK